MTARAPLTVIAGLDPAILCRIPKMAGSSPAMTQG
jgi:hypothetical protein